MFLAACAIALFCLISASCSAPLGCEDLVRPLDHVDLHSEDGWAFVSGSQKNNTEYLEGLKSTGSARLKFFNSSNPGDFLVVYMADYNGTCEYFPSNVTLKGSSYSSKSCSLNVTALHTSCPDCLLLRYMHSEEVTSIFLYSKRRELEQKELEEFRAQVECLKRDPPVVMDPTKELCPLKTPEQLADITEEQKD